MKNKIIFFTLTFFLAICLMGANPNPVYAFSGGNGTFSNPYKVATPADLNEVRDYPNSCYIQTADIDLSGYSDWLPIGPANYIEENTKSFAGTYDGGGFKISNLKMTSMRAYRTGLFSSTKANSLLIRVNLENVNINNVGTHVSGLVGRSFGTVLKCSVTGSVTGSLAIGGLVGENYGLVEECYADVQVSGSGMVGGLIGDLGTGSTVKNSYSTGQVLSGATSTGGLVGTNSYGTVTGSYYDRETSGQSDTGKGVPLTTAQMKQQVSYVGWDFTVVWQITENASYPQLRRDNAPFLGLGTPAVPYRVSNAYQLNRVRDYRNSRFIQTKDIDLSGVNWVPIGEDGNSFNGSYNGNNFTIRNLYSHQLSNAGLFGAVGTSSSSSLLTNINLVNVNVQGGWRTAGLVVDCVGTISNCHVSGSVSGADFVGGLAAICNEMDNSSSTATVSGTHHIGGLVGYLVNGKMDKCYNTGNVTAATTDVGGLAGSTNSGEISNSYNTGNVTGTTDVGGLAGRSYYEISNSYNTGNVTGTTYVGGCIGVHDGRIQSVFYNSDNITCPNINDSDPNQGVSKTTSEMKQQGTYPGWNFSSLWKITSGASYPQCKWENYRDSALPTLAGTFPASGSTEAVLLINFDEPMQKGTGNITITSQDEGSVVNVDAADSQVAVNNNQVTITLAESLTRGTTYTIAMAAGAFIDAAGYTCRAAAGYFVPADLARPAYGGTATASSSLPSLPIGKINDGIRDWYWNDNTNGNYVNDWCEVNWPTVQEIDKIVLRLPVMYDHPGNEVRTIGPLTLQYRDGNGVYQDLTTVDRWTAPSTDDGTQKKSFTYYPALNTKAVRVKFTGGNSDGWVFLEELEVYNEPNAMVSAEDNHYAVDNDNNTIVGGATVITADTTVAAFLGNLTKHSESIWKVVAATTDLTSVGQFNGAAGKAEGDSMAPGDKLAVLAGDNTTLKVYNVVVKSIRVGSQSGTITPGTAGSATFAVTTANIPDGTAVTVSWCDASGNAASVPTGLSVAGTNVASSGSTITVTVEATAAGGTYYFTATGDGVTSGVTAVTVGLTNLALSAYGGTAEASSTHSSLPVSRLNDGVRVGYWNDNTKGVFLSDWCQVSWLTAKEINKVVLRLPVMLSSYTEGQRKMGPLILQYCDESNVYHDLETVDIWVAPTTYDGTERKAFAFPAINAKAIRVKFTGGNTDGWAFLEEIEAYNAPMTSTITIASAENGTGTGGGIYSLGQRVTVGATPAEGYNFDGWNNGETKVSSLPNYTFAAAGDITLTPSFIVMPKSDLVVDIIGSGTVKQNDNTSLSSGTRYQQARNKNIRLTATPDEGYTFAGWQDDAAKRILSTDPVYECRLGTGVHVQAVFNLTPSDVGPFTVVFKDQSGRILKTESVDQNSEAHPPTPSLTGYAFIGWDQDYTNVTSASALTINALYKRLDTKYTVTVEDGTLSTGETSGDFQYDKQVTVTANAAPAGKKFSHWERDGVKISTKSNCSIFTPMKGITLTAVFVDEATVMEDVPFISLSHDVQVDETDGTMMFFANREVTGDYTLVESGILLLKSTDGSGELTVDTENVILGRINNTSVDQFYVRRMNINADETWYARAYLIYQDAQGNIVTVYSDNTVSETMN